MENTGLKAQPDIPEERELIRRAKAGNHQAFNGLVYMYRKRVFRLAYGFFHDRDEAMEIVQETFLRVFQKLDHFDHNTRFRNWIYRIAMNLCIDYHRKFIKRHQNPDHLFQLVQHQSGDTVDPEDHLIALKQKQILRRSISRLPKRQKMIFILKHYGHYKYREIADILSISVGSIKSLHHRSINKIKRDVVSTRVR
jgi:RNA polymerase sigma-70 factor (ECF subfamily)